MPADAQSILVPAAEFADDRRMALLTRAAGMANTTNATPAAMYACSTSQRRHALDPHHRGRRVTDDAAGAAAVRRGNDGGEKADVHAPLEDGRCDRAADDRGGDVVEERRQHEHDREQREPALPAVRQKSRQGIRDRAPFEVAREHGEAEQQEQEIREHDPLVREVRDGIVGRERAGDELPDQDGGEAGERDGESVTMQDRHAGQREAEQYELYWHPRPGDDATTVRISSWLGSN